MINKKEVKTKMDKKGETEFIPNLFVKVLLIFTVLLAFLWGLNGIYIGIFLGSFTQVFSFTIARIIDGIVGLATTLIAVILFVRIIKRD